MRAAISFASTGASRHAAQVITKRHTSDNARSSAIYSDCETYRYSLTRRWAAGPQLAYIMLNPSTATELRNDPTIERCERRARAGGYASFSVTNLFALRAKDPKTLRQTRDPIGPRNDHYILKAAKAADTVIAAWGVHGALMGRGDEVTHALRRKKIALFHLGLSKEGHPRHPLYIPYRQSPVPWPTPTDEARLK